MKTKPPGLARSTKTPENIATMRMTVTRSPSWFSRRRSKELNMNLEAIRRVLQLDLKFHPYKIQVVQLRKATDYVQRQWVCKPCWEITLMQSCWWVRRPIFTKWLGKQTNLLLLGPSKSMGVHKTMAFKEWKVKNLSS